jgi:hypothetical protein
LEINDIANWIAALAPTPKLLNVGSGLIYFSFAIASLLKAKLVNTACLLKKKIARS